MGKQRGPSIDPGGLKYIGFNSEFDSDSGDYKGQAYAINSNFVS